MGGGGGGPALGGGFGPHWALCSSPRQSRGAETSPLTRRKSYDRGQPVR